MKKIIVFLVLIFSSSLMAVFSAFETINPETAEKHNFVVKISEYKEKSELYKINIRKYAGNKQFWVLETNRRLRPGEMNFREYIWYGRDEWGRVESHKQLKMRTVENPDFEKSYTDVEITIPKDKIRKYYIYMDFAHEVMDGGYYYTVDLLSFIEGGVK